MPKESARSSVVRSCAFRVMAPRVLSTSLPALMLAPIDVFTMLDAKAPAAAPASELLEALPPEATDTDPPTASAWNLLSVLALALMLPAALTFASSMKARTGSALPSPTSLIATDTPIDSERVALDVWLPVPQATDTAPACENTCVLSVAVRATSPALEFTPRPSATLLSLMKAWVSRCTELTDAAPARATLLVLPRATAPPIDSASTIVVAVASSVMLPSAVTLAWWMYACVTSVTTFRAKPTATDAAVDWLSSASSLFFA